MNSFHEKIRTHGYVIKAHVKKHHKKYVGGFFAGFAVVKVFLLIFGFFVSLNSVSNTFAVQQNPDGLTGTCSLGWGTLIEQETCHSDNVELIITRSNPSSFTTSLFCPNELQGCTGVSINHRSDSIVYTGYFPNDLVGIYHPTCLIGSATNQVYSGSFYIYNLDKIKPTIGNIGETYTGYECGSITGFIDATDHGCGSGKLYYFWSGVVDTTIWDGTGSDFFVENDNMGIVNLNFFVRDDAKPRCHEQIGGRCGGYNDSTGIIYLQWLDVPLVLNSGSTQNIGELTGNYVVNDIVSLFEAEAGDCETITGTVITGNRATCEINGNTLTIYPNPGHNASGYCEISFTDGDTVQIGRVNFTINVLDCNPDRDNDNFLTGRFWIFHPSKDNIICALYGSGPNDTTAYTKQWQYNYDCPWNTMSVITTSTLPTPLADNTIYVLNSSASAPQSLEMGKCTAIVSQYGTVLKKVGITANKQYSILDGIELRGEEDAIQNGVNIMSNNFTINNIAVSHMTKFGIYMRNASYSVINNAKVYNTKTNNNAIGIEIEGSKFNTLNNLQVYNHVGLGVYFLGGRNNTFNNSQVYNNSEGVRLENNSDQNYLNNIWYYNNNYALTFDNSNSNFLNKNVFFNNNRDVQTINSPNNKYCDKTIYGIDLAALQAGATNECGQYGWTQGIPKKENLQSWDYMTNPIGNGKYLLDWNINSFQQLIGVRDFGYVTGYSYGVSIAGQENPLIYSGSTLTQWNNTDFAPNYINTSHYIGSNLNKTTLTVNVRPSITSGNATVQVTGDGSLKFYNVYGNVSENKYGEDVDYSTGIQLDGDDGLKYVVGQIYDSWYFATHRQHYPVVLDTMAPICSISYDNTPTSGNVELTIISILEQNLSGYSWDGNTFTSNGNTSGVSDNGVYTGFVIDAVGYVGICSETVSNIDRQGPTVVLTGNIVDSCVSAGTWVITGTFGEDVVGVTQDTLSGNDFTIQEFHVVTTGRVYEWEISSIDDNFGTINVFIDTGAVTDLAGNENSSSNELIWNYDSQGPNFLISEAPGTECVEGSWATVIVYMGSDNGCAGTGNTNPYSWDGDTWVPNQTFQLRNNYAGTLNRIIYVRDTHGNYSTETGHFVFGDTLPDMSTGNLTYQGVVGGTMLLYEDLRQEMGVKDGACGSGTISTIGSISCDVPGASAVWSGYGIVVTPPAQSQGRVVCTVTFKDDEENEITGTITYQMNTMTTHTVTIVAIPTGYGTVSPTSVTAGYNAAISITDQSLNIGGTNITAAPHSTSDGNVYSFSGWINDDCGDTLTDDCTITGEFVRSCDTNYTWNGTICEADTKSVSCSNLPEHATWTNGNFIQTWNGSAWAPASHANTNSNDSSVECSFTCDTNYTWNGTICEADTKQETCSNLPEHATWTNGNFTQTWNGSAWAPASHTNTNSNDSSVECSFTCDTNYTWDGNSCEADTKQETCSNLPEHATWTNGNFTQTWNGSAWAPASMSWSFGGTECGFECMTDYHWDGNACVSDTKSVQCDDPGIAFSSVNIQDVSVSWDWNLNNGSGGWESTPLCEWRCNVGYAKIGDNSCEPFNITINGPGDQCATGKIVSATPSIEGAEMMVRTGLNNSECNSGTFASNAGVYYTSGNDLSFNSENDSGTYVCFKATTGGVSVYSGVQLTNIDKSGPEVGLDIDSTYYTTGDKTLAWQIVTDSGCSTVSGYYYTLYSGEACEAGENVITGGIVGSGTTGFSFTGENEHSYCLAVYAEDGLGNTGITTTGTFSIDTNSLGCYISNPEACTSGNVVMTLSGSKVGNDIYLSWTENEGGIPGVQSITGQYNTGGRVITGYIYQKVGEVVVKTGSCTGEVEMIDRGAPTITSTQFIAEVVECNAVALSGIAIDEGCGSGDIQYKFVGFSSGDISRNGRDWSVNNSLDIPGINLYHSGAYHPEIRLKDSVGNTRGVQGTISVQDTPVVLDTTGIDLGILTENYIGESGLIEIFGPNEGSCETGRINIAAGNCYNVSDEVFDGATISMVSLNGNGWTGYMINFEPNIEGTGYCEVLFSDDEGNVATGEINFYVDTTYCLQNWDNNHFLTPEFWGMQHNDNQIICALYGSGTDDPETAYTKGWSGYDGTNCSGFDEMDVEWIDSQELTLPLTENTIYVLTTTGTQVTGTVNLPECTAIVSSMVDGYDTVLYSNGHLTNSMISLTGKYGILDNISVDGRNKLNGQTHDKNGMGIILSGAESNTFNVVKVYNNAGDGIKVTNSELNLLNNIQAYNNVGAGIKLMTGSMYNSLANIQSYRNGTGIYMVDANANAVSNINVYGNNWGLFITGNSNENVFNNLDLYYNSGTLAYLAGSGGPNKTNINLYVSSGLSNTYYGYLKIYPGHAETSGTNSTNSLTGYNFSNSNAIWEYKDYKINSMEKVSAHIADNTRYFKHWTGVVTCNFRCYETGTTLYPKYYEVQTWPFDVDAYCMTNSGSFREQSCGTSTRPVFLENAGTGFVDHIKYSYVSLNLLTKGSDVSFWSNGENVNKELRDISYITNPRQLNQSYLYSWVSSIAVYGMNTLSQVDQYSYGYQMSKQIKPVVWSGNNWTNGGDVDTGYYIGSNVSTVSGWIFNQDNNQVTKVEYLITGNSQDIHLVDTFELLQTASQSITGRGYTGLEFRFVNNIPSKDYKQTTLTGVINTAITVYVETGTVGSVSYNFIPQYYGAHYFATHYGVEKISVSSPYITFSPTTGALASLKKKHIFENGLQMTKRSDESYCISSGSVDMTGTWSNYYGYMTGFDETDLFIHNTGEVIQFSNASQPSISGNVRRRTYRNLPENELAGLDVYNKAAEDAVEIKSVGNEIRYYYDTQGPGIIGLGGNIVDECTATTVSLVANDACYISGYMFTGFVGQDWSVGSGISISSGDIGRRGGTKNLTGKVRDWLGYTTETGISIIIQNVEPILDVKVVDVQLYNQCNYVWSGNLISEFFAKEGNCGIDDLIATGLVCEGVTGVLNNNDFENFSFVGDSVTGHCEVKIVDNEYINGDTGSYDTGSIDFTRNDDCALLPSCMIDKAAVCTSGEVMLTYSGSDGVVSGSLNNGEIFDYNGHLETIGVSTTGTYKLTVYNSVGLSETCEVTVTTGELDNDDPTIQTGSWVGYECETGSITITGNDSSCGREGLTYDWSGINIHGETYMTGRNNPTSLTIQVSVMDGVGHKTSSAVVYSRENTGINLDRLSYSLGEIVGETTIETGMLELFGAREGACGTGDITVSTGDCEGASRGLDGNKLTIIPSAGQDGSQGYCEVNFSDTEGSVETGKINFGANTWQWSCVENWDNDNFLDENFWSSLSTVSDIRDTEIICALYGTGEEDKTAYTKGWSGWDYSQCSGRYMDVEFVNTLPNNLSGNTIYVLDTDTVELSNSVNMAKCSAIISKDGSTIINETQLNTESEYKIDNNYGYGILDNIAVKSLNLEKDYCISIRSNNNTIHNAITYMCGRGLGIEGYNNIINNFVTFNNSLYGLQITKSGYNSINNVLSFNNGVIGSTISSYGIFINSSENNILNNIILFNNINVGLYMSNASGTKLNDIKIYNNDSGLSYNGNGQNKVGYYGSLFVYSGVLSLSNKFYQGGSEYSILGWNEGQYSTGGEISFDLMVNPVDDSGNYLLGWSNEYNNLRGNKTIGQVVGYSYGSGIGTQVQPVARSENEIIEVGNAKTENYIGSNVKKVAGNLILPDGVIQDSTITVTGFSDDEGITGYSVFGDINPEVIGQINKTSTGIIFSSKESDNRRLVTQLFGNKLFATHFEKNVTLNLELYLTEFTGGYGSAQCTGGNIFTVTGVFNKALVGVKLLGENVSMQGGCTDENGCDTYVWTVILSGGVGKVWVNTGGIAGYVSSGVSDEIILGNYDAGNGLQVELLSPSSGKVFTGGNKIVDLVWSGSNSQRCATISGYIVLLCTGVEDTEITCDNPIWTGWTNGTGVSTGELADGRYHWKVQGQDEFGRTGEWSQVGMFEVDNTSPGGDGDGLGLTGGFGDICTSGNIFTLTGRFSEAVVGVNISGENVAGLTLVEGSDGSSTYVWTGRLTGGTGRVWFVTGNIRDMHSNPYSGSDSSLVLGNYDNEGPSAVTLTQPGNKVYTLSTTLRWQSTIDSGCAGVSGYNWEIYQGSCGNGTSMNSGFVSSGILSADVNGLSDNTSYCRRVQPVDNFGNEGEWTSGSFVVDLSNIGCTITPLTNMCTSGTVQVQLVADDDYTANGPVYLSWIGTGDYSNTNNLITGLTYSGQTVIGYISQPATNKSNDCEYSAINIIDQIAPMILGLTGDSVPECTTGTANITADDDGCGDTSLTYKWSGNADFGGDTSYLLWSGKVGTKVVNVQVKDAVGNITGSSVIFEWTNSPISGHDFTGNTNVGNGVKTVNWKVLSEVVDGACGSGTVSYSGIVQNGLHGTCNVDGENITYTPNLSEQYEGSDRCIIQVKDDENTTKDIVVYWGGIDTDRPTCNISHEPQYCVSGNVTLTISVADGLNYSWTNWGQTGTDQTKIVSANGTYVGYVWDEAGNTGSCSTGVNNISTGVLVAPNNLTPVSGSKMNETPTLSWGLVSANGCRTVSGYKVFVLSGGVVIDSGVIGNNTTNWTPNPLPRGIYEWYVQAQDILGGVADSDKNTFVIDDEDLICEINYPGQCTSGDITLILIVNKDLSTNMESLGWTMDISNPHRYTKVVNSNTGINFVVQDIYGNTSICAKTVDKFDNMAPQIVQTINASGYECEMITGYVVANDELGDSCGSLTYSWSGGDYLNMTGYGIYSQDKGERNVTISVKDMAGNQIGGMVHYVWQDVALTLDTTSLELDILTGSKVVENVISTFGARAGNCETIDTTVTSNGDVSCTLSANNLTMNPHENVEGHGSCIIVFTDGDTVETGIVDFDIDTKRPTGRGGELGLTGGLGTAQCTNADTFTVTGIFSEVVTGVALVGENVEIVANNGQGQREYVWTVKLTGGIGKVRIVGDIKDIHGNPLSGTVDELIVGNYDNEGPNKVEQIYPLGGIVPTTNVTLQWNPTTDRGCAGDVTYSYVLTGTDYVNSGTDLSGTSANVSDLENGHRYCRNVIATDKYGNSKVSNTSCFTVNTGGIQCTIVANRTTCGSGPVVLTLAGVGEGDARGEWLSRSNVGNTGNMTKIGSLTKIITGFVSTIGYVQNRWGQTGYCEFTIEQLQDILDLQGSEITGINYRSGYECSTGTLTMDVSEDGCGQSGLIYKWNGVLGQLSNSIYGRRAQVITGIFSAINGAGVTTSTGYRFEWLDSPVTATGFTVDLTHGNRVDWKLLSNASDGACGPDPLTATVSSGSKGTCRVDGSNLYYLPSYTFTGSDSCVLTISDDDGGTVSVVVNFDNVSPYVELISPEDNAELDQGNVVFSWVPRDVPLEKQISGYIYQIGTITGFVNTTGVTLNLTSGKYPWSVAIEYADSTAGGHSDLRSVKTVASSGGRLVKDYCPNGDNSDSYYDGVCDNKDIHEVADLCNVMYSNYTNEEKGAYLYAYIKGITTQCPISAANLDGYLHRDELAKMISVYAINVVGREPKYGKAGCDKFDDISNDVPELQDYMKLSCELELMGMHADGVTPKSYFDPHSIVTRAEFGTVFSRLLFGDLYNVKDESLIYKQEGYRYKAHLQALKDYGVMTKVDGEWPKYLERRGWTMLMLQRADDYGLFKGKSPALNGISALFSN